jgi:hypothetical protein
MHSGSLPFGFKQGEDDSNGCTGFSQKLRIGLKPKQWSIHCRWLKPTAMNANEIEGFSLKT